MTHRCFFSAVVVFCFSLALVPARLGWAADQASPTGVSPEPAAAVTIKLADAVRKALDSNHEIKAFQHGLAASKEEVGTARANLLPKVSIEERYMRTTNPTYAFMAKLNQERFTQSDFDITNLNKPEAIDDYQTSFSFEQPIFARKANVGLAMAKTQYLSKKEEYVRRQENIAFKVVSMYLAASAARDYVAVSEQALENAREHKRIADLRYHNHLGLYSDTLRAATAVTEAEQQMVSAGKNLAVARRGLGLLLGSDQPVTPADNDLDQAVKDIDYYTDAAMGRSDIKALELQGENARNNLKLATAGYLPVLGVGGLYQLNDHADPFGTEGDSWQVSAFLRWEMFDGTKRWHERQQAQYQIDEVQENIKAMKKGVAFKVYEAYLAVDEARKNAELAQDALKSAEEGRRLVKARYENSLSQIIDLLDAQVALDHSRANAIARQKDYQQAVMKLRFESGTILEEFGVKQLQKPGAGHE